MAIDFKKYVKFAPLGVGVGATLGLVGLKIRAAHASTAKPGPATTPAKPAANVPPPIPVVNPPPAKPAPAPPVIVPGGVPLTPNPSGTKAIVTTNDPAPAGDLIIRTQPNPSAPQIPGGGADKEGIVTVVRTGLGDGSWSEVYWPGGRRPGGQGFAKSAYLKPVSNVVIPPAAVIGQQAIVTTNDPAPAGDLLIRAQPNPTAATVGSAEKNGKVTIVREIDGTWCEVMWPGGSRRPPCQGFTRKAYLRVV